MTTKSYIVLKDKAQVLSNKTIDADSNVIQNLEAGNFKAQATSEAGKCFGVKSDGSIGLISGGSPAVDNTTIEINSDDKLAVKDGGISLAKLATQATTDKDKCIQVDTDGTFKLSDSGYLPLSGGTMTGSIVFNPITQLVMSMDGDSPYEMQIWGGSDSSKCAKLHLGNDTSGDGAFTLYAQKESDHQHILKGDTDGNLTWDGSDVVTGKVMYINNGFSKDTTRDMVLANNEETNSAKYYPNVVFTTEESPTSSASESFWVTADKISDTEGCLFARSISSGEMYVTTCDNGTWSSWVRLATATNLSSYLPLTGGTLSGDLDIAKNTPILTFKDTTGSSYCDIRIKDSSGNTQAAHRVYPASGGYQLARKASGGSNWWNGANIVLGYTGALQLQSSDANGNAKATVTLTNDGYINSGNTYKYAGNDANIILSDSDSKSFWITGGTGINSGSTIRLCGKSNSNSGSFLMRANNGTNSCTLFGSAAGSLTWNSKSVTTSERIKVGVVTVSVSGKGATAISASVTSGYTFICWLGCSLLGANASAYIQDHSATSTNVVGGGTTGSYTAACYFLQVLT